MSSNKSKRKSLYGFFSKSSTSPNTSPERPVNRHSRTVSETVKGSRRNLTVFLPEDSISNVTKDLPKPVPRKKNNETQKLVNKSSSESIKYDITAKSETPKKNRTKNITVNQDTEAQNFRSPNRLSKFEGSKTHKTYEVRESHESPDTSGQSVLPLHTQVRNLSTPTYPYSFGSKQRQVSQESTSSSHYAGDHDLSRQSSSVYPTDSFANTHGSITSRYPVNPFSERNSSSLIRRRPDLSSKRKPPPPLPQLDTHIENNNKQPRSAISIISTPSSIKDSPVNSNDNPKIMMKKIDTELMNWKDMARSSEHFGSDIDSTYSPLNLPDLGALKSNSKSTLALENIAHNEKGEENEESHNEYNKDQKNFDLGENKEKQAEIYLVRDNTISNKPEKTENNSSFSFNLAEGTIRNKTLDTPNFLGDLDNMSENDDKSLSKYLKDLEIDDNPLIPGDHLKCSNEMSNQIKEAKNSKETTPTLHSQVSTQNNSFELGQSTNTNQLNFFSPTLFNKLGFINDYDRTLNVLQKPALVHKSGSETSSTSETFYDVDEPESNDLKSNNSSRVEASKFNEKTVMDESVNPDQEKSSDKTSRASIRTEDKNKPEVGTAVCSFTRYTGSQNIPKNESFIESDSDTGSESCSNSNSNSNSDSNSNSNSDSDSSSDSIADSYNYEIDNFSSVNDHVLDSTSPNQMLDLIDQIDQSQRRHLDLDDEIIDETDHIDELPTRDELAFANNADTSDDLHDLYPVERESEDEESEDDNDDDTEQFLEFDVPPKTVGKLLKVKNADTEDYLDVKNNETENPNESGNKDEYESNRQSWTKTPNIYSQDLRSSRDLLVESDYNNDDIDGVPSSQGGLMIISPDDQEKHHKFLKVMNQDDESENELEFESGSNGGDTRVNLPGDIKKDINLMGDDQSSMVSLPTLPPYSEFSDNKLFQVFEPVVKLSKSVESLSISNELKFKSDRKSVSTYDRREEPSIVPIEHSAIVATAPVEGASKLIQNTRRPPPDFPSTGRGSRSFSSTTVDPEMFVKGSQGVGIIAAGISKGKDVAKKEVIEQLPKQGDLLRKINTSDIELKKELGKGEKSSYVETIRGRSNKTTLKTAPPSRILPIAIRTATKGHRKTPSQQSIFGSYPSSLKHGNLRPRTRMLASEMDDSELPDSTMSHSLGKTKIPTHPDAEILAVSDQLRRLPQQGVVTDQGLNRYSSVRSARMGTGGNLRLFVANPDDNDNSD